MRLPATLLLGPSRRLLAIQLGAHALAATAVLPLTLPWPVRIALLAAILVSLANFLVRRRRPAVSALHLGTRGDLEVELKVGARETATVLRDTAILPGLILLSLRRGDEGGKGGIRLMLPLFPDALSADAYRQLSVWLRSRASIGQA